MIALLLQVGPVQYPSPQADVRMPVVVRHKTSGPSKLEKRVGKLMAKGKCDEARSMALEGGAIDLAARVREDCR
jgi:hypothetical protein